MHIDDNLRAGMTSEEARRQALIKLGGVDVTKESYRDRRGIPPLETLLQDLRFSARMLQKNPGFTSVAVLTLALGIGANTAFFGVLNTTLFRPLPYPHPEQLVHINERAAKSNGLMPVSYPDFIDWKRQQVSFCALAIYRPDSLNFSTETGTDRVFTVLVDHDFLKALGVQPALGRDLTVDDDRTGAPLAVLISHATWSTRFMSDPAVLGRTLRVEGKSGTIVGILPPTFQFFRNGELILPLGPFAEQLYIQMRESHSAAMVVGRLKPGVSFRAAQEEMDAIAVHLAAQYPKSNSGIGVTVMDLRRYLMGDAKQGQLLLMGAVGLVLLIVCVNIAILLLARSSAREREMALRTALGANRNRLIRQLLVESLVLAVMGGGLGLLLATGLSATLGSLVPFQLR
jgi:predicted permease